MLKRNRKQRRKVEYARCGVIDGVNPEKGERELELDLEKRQKRMDKR